MSEAELEILEEILNEEAYSYIDSGYSSDCDYVKNIRSIIKKMNLKEQYNFDKKRRNK